MVLLLVRRTGSPDNKGVLWKRNNEEQTGPVPLKLESGAGALQTSTSISEIAGEEAKNFITDIEKFLHTTLEGARMAFKSYDNPDIVPFFLSVPKGNTQKSLTQKMTGIQNTTKQEVKKYLGDVTRGIGDITKNPQGVIIEMEKITGSISAMCIALTLVSGLSYKVLVPKVGREGNEKHIENTKTYLIKLRGYRDDAFKSFDSIKAMLDSGKVTFKRKTPSRFSNFKSGVKKRLGIKKKSSTGVPPNLESPNQDTSYQGESNQGPPDQQAPDQKGIRPTPAPRLSKLIGPETRV
ncbi:hypothetical protein BASA60_011000 [Batrachochytrium salamandrivorans]|nr:hypothetical protein BASA60_011000 [Batrachochytrium salamandrivorans]